MQDYYKDLRRCQNEAWGMADRLRIQQAGPKDMHKRIRPSQRPKFN